MQMNPAEARIVNYAETLLMEHGYSLWSVKLNNAVKQAGVCNYTDKTVGLSRKLIAARSVEASLNTVRHEVAHVIAGSAAGHGPKWQKICKDLGGDGKRCYEGEVDRSKAPTKYTGTCPAGHQVHFARMLTSRRSCGKCSPGVFSEAHLFTIKDNRTGQIVTTYAKTPVRRNSRTRYRVSPSW